MSLYIRLGMHEILGILIVAFLNHYSCSINNSRNLFKWQLHCWCANVMVGQTSFSEASFPGCFVIDRANSLGPAANISNMRLGNRP